MSAGGQMRREEQAIEDRYTFGDIDESEYRQELRDMRKEFKEIAHEDAEDERRNEKRYS